MDAEAAEDSPLSPRREAEVREHLADILRSPAFCNSPKASSFLEFTVGMVLAGKQGQLKERAIGIEIFGREPGFETAGDSIVRVKASEVRKRLTRYYELKAPETLRIELPSGSYAPVFHWMGQDSEAAAPSRSRALGSLLRGRRRILTLTGAGIALAAIGAAGWFLKFDTTPAEDFWEPLVKSPRPAMICISYLAHGIIDVGPLEAALKRTAQDSKLSPPASLEDLGLLSSPHVALCDFTASIAVDHYLRAFKKDTEMKMVEGLPFEQLRGSPMIVIGLSNPWAVTLTRELPFAIRHDLDSNRAFKLLDQTSGRRWLPEKRDDFVDDYALIARVREKTTGQLFMIFGGLSYYSTPAAAEFATTPSCWRNFAATAPRDWKSKNLEIVLKTRIVRGVPSPPSVVATRVW